MPAARQSLKRATRALIGAVGGQEAAVGFCRIRRQQALSEYCSVAADHIERFAPIDVIADLEGVTAGFPGAPHVTRELARQAGFVLVPLPAAHETADLADCLPRIIRETADVTAALAAQLSAARFALPSALRPAALRREIAEAVQALMDCDALLAEVQP